MQYSYRIRPCALGRTAAVFAIATFGGLSLTVADFLESTKDPDAQGISAQSRLFVIAKGTSRSFASTIETEFAERIHRKCGIEVLMSQTVFPPTRSYSDEDRFRIITETGVEAVIRIVLADSEVLTKQIMVRTSPWTAVAREQDAGVADAFELSLERLTPGPKLWVATAHYQEDDHEEAAHDLASDAVDDLISKGLLPNKLKASKPKARR